MSGRPLLPGARSLRISLFASIAVLNLAGTVWPEPRKVAAPPLQTPSKADSTQYAKALAEFKSRVDAIQLRLDAVDKEGAIPDIRRDVSTLRADLTAASQAEVARADERTSRDTPQEGAWQALWIVGVAFVAAWTLVSTLREGSRRQEAIATAVATLAEKALHEKDKDTFERLLTKLCEMMPNSAGSVPTRLAWLRRWFGL